MNIINIRPANINDTDAVSALVAEIMDIHHDLDPKYYEMKENSAAEFKKWATGQINNPYSFIILSEDMLKDPPEITGFIAGFSKPLFPWFNIKSVGHISFLIIKEKYRRKGIGSLLVSEAEKWFKDKNISYIETYVDEKNHQGVVSWSKFGYTPFKKFLRKNII